MYATIHSLHKILNSNDAYINTDIGYGMMGYLCLTLSPTVYATLLTTRVVLPPNPGAMPIIPTGATGPKAASIRYAHDTATLAFNTFNNVDRALCQQILGAVEDTFLRVKHKLHCRYSGSSTLSLLTYLY